MTPVQLSRLKWCGTAAQVAGVFLLAGRIGTPSVAFAVMLSGSTAWVIATAWAREWSAFTLNAAFTLSKPDRYLSVAGMSATPDLDKLAAELRSPVQIGPVDPKANYRTKPVATMEQAANAITNLKGEVEAAKKGQTCLAQAIGDAVIKAGLCNPVPMTGPELMLFVDNLADAYLSAQAALALMTERVGALEAGLEPFAAICDAEVYEDDTDRSQLAVRVMYLRAARALLRPTEHSLGDAG